MNPHARLASLIAATSLSIAVGSARAGEIRVACYSDGNECEVTQDLAKRFEAQNSDVKVVIDKVPYKAILEQLPVQLAAGEGPGHRARHRPRWAVEVLPRHHAVCEGSEILGGELRPDAALDAPVAVGQGHLRHDDPAHGHRTVCQQDAVRAGECSVAGAAGNVGPVDRRGAQGGQGDAGSVRVAFDRSGHRFAGPAISMGAKYFNAKGDLVVDDGYRAMAKKLYDWNRDGTMPKEVWGGVGGATYRDAFEEFANGRVVMYLSGSWQIRRMDSQIGKNFDWIAIPNPCGPAACTGIPGGAAFVALKRSKNPKDVGRFLDYLASEPVYAEYMARTENIPANASVAKKGVDYKISPQARAALNVVRRRSTQAVAGRLPDPGLQAQPRDLQPDRRPTRAGDRR